MLSYITDNFKERVEDNTRQARYTLHMLLHAIILVWYRVLINTNTGAQMCNASRRKKISQFQSSLVFFLLSSLSLFDSLSLVYCSSFVYWLLNSPSLKCTQQLLCECHVHPVVQSTDKTVLIYSLYSHHPLYQEHLYIHAVNQSANHVGSKKKSCRYR